MVPIIYGGILRLTSALEMTTPGNSRKPRADALRNRERLLEAAKQAFTEVGAQVSLDEIVRRAGVGIGTLYRHFPTREAVVEAVYRREIGQLADAAKELLESHRPIDALHAWLKLFVDYMATKRVIAPILASAPGAAAALYESSGSLIQCAVTLLLDQAIAAREIRSDIEPSDMMQALAGLAYGFSTPGWETRTLRLIDVLMHGLRPQQ
jgi:AcrR family transcriptional regulator